MPQVTLSVPQEKMPVLNNLLKELGIKISSAKALISRDFYKVEMPLSTEKPTPTLIERYFSWDNNRSELEFE